MKKKFQKGQKREIPAERREEAMNILSNNIVSENTIKKNYIKKKKSLWRNRKNDNHKISKEVASKLGIFVIFRNCISRKEKLAKGKYS